MTCLILLCTTLVSKVIIALSAHLLVDILRSLARSPLEDLADSFLMMLQEPWRRLHNGFGRTLIHRCHAMREQTTGMSGIDGYY